ncbi:MAG: hypothetical protein COW89_02665 [Nitrospinae bacterium CG22_combo_CG10-13_8_21_14_all_47_10]|nr:MAG: hypothetical protein COW89_02665 [Nitrospinae bacterium CG22_combo_CG10-13_8_21_14_all_47_10]
MKNVITPAKFAAGFLLFFSILCFFSPFATAKEISNPVSATTRITPDTFTLGDVATYTITVQHDPDIHPNAPDIEPPGGLEFIEKGIHPTKKTNGQTIDEYWYKFRVDETGLLSIPAIPVTFTAPNPKETGKTIEGTILAPEANLEVQSLLAIQGSQEGIHDIKSLEEYPLPWLDYSWWALAALALSGLFYFLWRKWKSRPTSLDLPPTASTLTPEQLAFKELEELRNKGWLQIGRVQDHFFELSEIFRRYLENRYQFPAQEWTTEEITAHFKHFSGLSEDLKLRARSILTQTDRVKFAKAEQANDEMESVISFIHEARPITTQEVGQP